MDLEKYNGIEIPARNKMIWEEAILFYQLGQDAQKKMEEDKKYIVPAIVNVAFSCELFLKSMLKDGTKGHLLSELFKEIPDSLREFIKDRMIINGGLKAEAVFDKRLENISNAFAEWRYFYEDSHDGMTLDYEFLNFFALAMKNLDVLYNNTEVSKTDE